MHWFLNYKLKISAFIAVGVGGAVCLDFYFGSYRRLFEEQKYFTIVSAKDDVFFQWQRSLGWNTEGSVNSNFFAFKRKKHSKVEFKRKNIAIKSQTFIFTNKRKQLSCHKVKIIKFYSERTQVDKIPFLFLSSIHNCK